MKETRTTTMMMTMMLAFRLVHHLEHHMQSCETCLSSLPSRRLRAFLRIQKLTLLLSLQVSLSPPLPSCLPQLWPLWSKPTSIPTQSLRSTFLSIQRSLLMDLWSHSPPHGTHLRPYPQVRTLMVPICMTHSISKQMCSIRLRLLCPTYLK